MKSPQQGAATTVWAALSDAARPGAYHEDCNPRESPTTLATDDDAAERARRLWDESERMVATWLS